MFNKFRGRKNNQENIEKAFEKLTLAVQSESSGNEPQKTLELYNQALQALEVAVKNEHDPSKKILLETKFNEFSEKANVISLLSSLPSAPEKKPELPPEELEIRQVYAEALALDEQGRSTAAVPKYMETVQKQLAYAKDLEAKQTSEFQVSKLKQDAIKIMDRVEQIKSPPKAAPSRQPTRQGNKSAQSKKPTPAKTTSPTPPAAGGLSPEEIQTLMISSTINGRIFQPWLDIDLKEKFTFPEPWCDPEGLLPLSAKQQRNFKGWERPSQIYPGADLCMIRTISPDSIQQDLVSDCSFVASLCITAAFEARFQKQLITRIIFPQNSRGVPIYNPSGKYMVKLWVNGVARKIVVDDRLPIDRRDNKPLCSTSTIEGELWVSIIEKAYMKVNGGYDFPGSNSGIDLFALTGWIPEGVQLQKMERNSEEYEKVWQRLLSAHDFGDCLITVNTANLGNEDDTEEERTGLVSSHAYAILDVREIKNYDGPVPPGVAAGSTLRMLKIKNPWAKKTWKGFFSRTDVQRWTQRLRSELQYSPEEAQQRDDGIFWMEYGILCKFFNSLNLNWNPELFAHRVVLHSTWSVHVGPKNDQYNLGDNPQYSLVVNLPTQDSKANPLSPSVAAPTIWILLSRHVLRKEAEPKDGDFLTVHVYDKSEGKRVFYPSQPLIRGTYSNNPHTLVSFDIPPGNKKNLYTLVISQYEKTRDVSYTLNVFCTSPFRLFHTPQTPEHRRRLVGAWTESSAGGSLGRPTYMNNPQFYFNTQSKSDKVHFQLQAPKEYSVNIEVVSGPNGGKRISSISQGEEILNSGSYRPGFCYVAGELPPGSYTIVVSTYKPHQKGNFILTVCSSKASSICRPIAPEGDGMDRQDIEGSWSAQEGTAVGCNNFGNYLQNPTFRLTCSSRASLILRLCCPQAEHLRHPAMNITMFLTDSNGMLHPRSSPKSSNVVATSNEGIYTDSKAGAATNQFSIDPGTYSIVISTFDPLEAPYRLVVFSQPRCTIARV